MITYRNLGYRGRLGNQLFQIAAVIGIARDRGDDPLFPATWLYRPYFSLPDEFFSSELPPYVVEATEFAPHLDPRCRDYLQDISLFIHHLPEIREYLTPSLVASQVMAQNIYFNTCDHPHLVVHVRRGDNVIDPGVPNKADYHPVPPLDYYLRAIEHFPGYGLWVFSDDVPWCRDNLPLACRYGHGVAYVKEHEPTYGTYPPTDWEDLFRMSSGDAFITTGSTFGIWGALLSGVDSEHVIRPDRVYGPLLTHINESALFHPEWRVVRCFST